MQPYYDDGRVTIYLGDCRDVLPSLAAGSVQTCITSPPYFGLRDYGGAAQIGLEATPAAYVAEMTGVFEQVRRVLRDDGTAWLNLGDSYSGGDALGRNDAGRNFTGGGGNILGSGNPGRQGTHNRDTGLKPKDLIGIPWRVAFALQDAGWWLRSDIIWAKGNPMPESVQDRPTKAHEYLFLLAMAERYYYDADAIREGFSESTAWTYPQPDKAQRAGVKTTSARSGLRVLPDAAGRNKRTVWTVNTQPYSGAHFAVFPEKLIEPCVLAGCPPGGIVLDPFLGSGTTARVAKRLGRRCIGIEQNEEYAEMAARSLGQDVFDLWE